ncbi:MAG TPA: prepilin-type N-terminal cleavage/methylation domain-containing protein [Candidatus Acidoferrum sp.]|nr:prepilin-type N-terminal cleavage/methylation domain-containing protein [Candidatus Acidoferrum sp.]
MNTRGLPSNLRMGKAAAKGFSLIELLIVVFIILIISAIAIPSLFRSKIAANESSAVSSIRQINTAEGTYASSWGSGYAAALPNLGGPQAACAAGATAANACLIDDLISVPPFSKSGYTFAAGGTNQVGGIFNGFEVNATANTVQTTGVRAFCSDATGVIKYVTPGPAPIGLAAGSCGGIASVAGTSGPVGN